MITHTDRVLLAKKFKDARIDINYKIQQDCFTALAEYSLFDKKDIMKYTNRCWQIMIKSNQTFISYYSQDSCSHFKMANSLFFDLI